MARTPHGEVRQRILDAAEHRLWHYGFKKTTIDEVAADAGVGKGTVYLYFDSKEDIALAIVSQFKETSLHEQQKIAGNATLSPIDKLKQILTYPAVMAHQRCVQSPSAQEMVMAVRPHIRERLLPFQNQEISLIASVLEEGNCKGIFAVTESAKAAKTLKNMCAAFWPPYPLADGEEDIGDQIGRIVDLAFIGLRNPAGNTEPHSLSVNTGVAEHVM